MHLACIVASAYPASRLVQRCLPTKAPRPPSGELWLHEIKHDGFRVIARRWAWLRPRRPRLPWGRVRQGLPCRPPRMGMGLAGSRIRPRPWRVELPLLRVVLLGPLHRLEWL